MRLVRFLIIAVTILPVVSTRSGALAPLGITNARGLPDTPVFEGWCEKPDGTFTLSFGKDNFIEPGRFEGPQPAVFIPRRHWGVFGVKVPAEF